MLDAKTTALLSAAREVIETFENHNYLSDVDALKAAVEAFDTTGIELETWMKRKLAWAYKQIENSYPHVLTETKTGIELETWMKR